MSKIEKRLSEYLPGEIFVAGSFVFIVLQHNKQGTIVMIDGSKTNYSLRFDGKTSDWSKSSIRNYLNTVILNNCTELFGEKNIIEVEIDLIDDRKNKKYGKCIDKVRLLTAPEKEYYDKVNKEVSKIYCSQWLITPFFTEKFDTIVCYSTFGNKIEREDCFTYMKACPVLTLKSDVVILKEEDRSIDINLIQTKLLDECIVNLNPEDKHKFILMVDLTSNEIRYHIYNVIEKKDYYFDKYKKAITQWNKLFK